MIAAKKRGPGFRNQILPTLASFGQKAPEVEEDLANPIVAWYATHFSRDWSLLYLYSLVAVEHIEGTTILRQPGEYHVLDIPPRFWAIPVRRRGRDIRAFDRLSEVLASTVTWMNSRFPTIIRDIQKYTASIENTRFLKPDSKLLIPAQKPGQRDWILYRWNSISLVIAVLIGPKVLRGLEIPTDNFPDDLQELYRPGRTFMAIMKIPKGEYPEYQLWSPEFSHMGIEEPCYAANYLQMNLACERRSQKRARRFRAMQFEMIPDKVKAEWWHYIASDFSSMDFSLLKMAIDKLAENGDFAECLKALFPDARQD